MGILNGNNCFNGKWEDKEFNAGFLSRQQNQRMYEIPFPEHKKKEGIMFFGWFWHYNFSKWQKEEKLMLRGSQNAVHFLQ